MAAALADPFSATAIGLASALPGGDDEACAPAISLCGRGCRDPRRIAHCRGANLSSQTGADRRRLSARGQSDILARLMGQWLSERLGQPFIIENRPGAGGTIATEAVVRAAPDGHTLLQVSSTHTTNATLYDRLNFNFVRDIAPVASITRTTYVMEVNPSFPARRVPEFIAYAKANPSKINMASADNGTVGHVAGELFKMMTGVDIIHVPYRGSGPALTDPARRTG
jgi:tripartite-type tricarboxylate transporter receptor subunit TctC